MTTNPFLWPEWGELRLRHRFNPHCLRRCNVLKRNDLIQIFHWFRSPFRCNVNWNYFITKHTAGKVILRHLFFILHQIDRFMINPQKLFVLRVFVMFTFSLIWCQIFFSLLFFSPLKSVWLYLKLFSDTLMIFFQLFSGTYWDGNRIVCILNENSPFFKERKKHVHGICKLVSNGDLLKSLIRSKKKFKRNSEINK